MKICICMSQTDNIKEYSSLTEKINKKYAKLHNYDFKMLNHIMTDRSPQWCKVKVVNECLEYNYDYLFWIDADAFFNKHTIKLEEIINQDLDKNIIICDDIANSGRNNTLNSGTFFVKCNDWSKQFFKTLWEYDGNYKYDYFHEQTMIEKYLDDNFMDSQRYISVRPAREFNTEINVQLNDNSIYDNFVIHLMGHTKDFRVQFINNWLQNNYELNYFIVFVVFVVFLVCILCISSILKITVSNFC